MFRREFVWHFHNLHVLHMYARLKTRKQGQTNLYPHNNINTRVFYDSVSFIPIPWVYMHAWTSACRGTDRTLAFINNILNTRLTPQTLRIKQYKRFKWSNYPSASGLYWAIVHCAVHPLLTAFGICPRKTFSENGEHTTIWLDGGHFWSSDRNSEIAGIFQKKFRKIPIFVEKKGPKVPFSQEVPASI